MVNIQAKDIKTRELRGFKSLRALNTFHTLMLGLKMLPMYRGEEYDEFLNRVSEMGDDDKEKMIRQAVRFVELQKEEVEACLEFCLDPNGVPYTASNIKNLEPLSIVECIVAVAMEVGRIKVDSISEAEKKNSLDIQSMS